VAGALATQLAGDTRPPLILAQDEGCCGSISRPHACWAPSKRRPNAPSHVVREGISACTAVTPFLGKRWTLLLPTADTEFMNMFVQEVRRTFSQYVLIMQGGIMPKNIRRMTQPRIYPNYIHLNIYRMIFEKYTFPPVFSSQWTISEKECVKHVIRLNVILIV